MENGHWTLARFREQFGDEYKTQSKLLQKVLKPRVKKSEAFARLASAQIQSAAEQLMNGRPLKNGWSAIPQVLFTPPNAEEWHVPANIWHVDVPRLGKIGCPGVQMFTFIDHVEAGGGGTLAVAGSHHFLNDQGKVRSKGVKKGLQRVPWFTNLFEKGQDNRHLLESPSYEGDIELQVVEMTGEPGDVYLMDLRLIHTLAPNASDRARLMATQRFLLRELSETALAEEDAA